MPWEISILPPYVCQNSNSNNKAASPSEVVDGVPAKVSLRTGEKVVITSSKPLSRSGREGVLFRIVGKDSFGWGEAAVIWGGHVEAVIHRHQTNIKIHQLFKLPKPISVAKALSSLSPPAETSWNGIMLGTIRDEEDAADAAKLFKDWQPLIAIFAVPVSIPRQEQDPWIKNIQASTSGYYNRKVFTLSHSAIGGVTTTRWRFTHLTRQSTLGELPKQAIMMAPQFSRPLQTALQDTIGGSSLKNVVFEKAATVAPLHGSSIVGFATKKIDGIKAPVYDSAGAAPDIGALAKKEQRIWVHANSVFSGDAKITRQVDTAELLAIWDYEGKYESKDWDSRLLYKILEMRLASPPAKMIRSLLFTAGEIVLSHVNPPPQVVESQPILQPGKTCDIPFNPMEEATDTRVKAAQADDAEMIYLSGHIRMRLTRLDGQGMSYADSLLNGGYITRRKLQ